MSAAPINATEAIVEIKFDVTMFGKPIQFIQGASEIKRIVEAYLQCEVQVFMRAKHDPFITFTEVPAWNDIRAEAISPNGSTDG